jgi:methylated-DNA-[protein]-cysteine S-methyltransferase
MEPNRQVHGKGAASYHATNRIVSETREHRVRRHKTEKRKEMPHLAVEEVPTLIGDLKVAVSAVATVAVAFPKSDCFESECGRWLRLHPDAPDPSPTLAREVADRLRAYFDGAVNALVGVPFDPAVPPSSRRVLEAVTAIPAGETRAYSEIARQLGYGALGARFVGSANARNPIPLVIPCHRVVGKDGGLVGYGGNLELKAWLLAWERHHVNKR